MAFLYDTNSCLNMDTYFFFKVVTGRGPDTAHLWADFGLAPPHLPTAGWSTTTGRCSQVETPGTLPGSQQATQAPSEEPDAGPQRLVPTSSGKETACLFLAFRGDIA